MQNSDKAKKVYLLAADGFEEVEGLTVVDLLRRDGIDIKIVSVSENKKIIGARKICITADLTIADIDLNADMIILPGGQPGVNNLSDNEKVKEIIFSYYKTNKLIGAICAAPMILGNMNLLKGKKATIYPGMEDKLNGGIWMGEKTSVAVDLPFVTSRGVGTSIDFALKIIEILDSSEASYKIAESVVYHKEEIR